MSRALSVVLSSVAIASACGGSRAPGPAAVPAGPETVVTLARAPLVDVPSVFEAGGHVRPAVAATVASRVLAAVVAVRVRPGDRVRRGQLLVELDGRELDANRARAIAGLASADHSVHAAEADVSGADAALTQSRATRDRIVTLFDKRSATAQERDDVTAACSAAEAHLAGARARLAAATSTLDAARAGADAAGIAASYATLNAPFDGVIAARHADPGDLATPGGELLVIEGNGPPYLEVTIDEARVRYVALHQASRVHLESATAGGVPSEPIEGHVIEIGRVDADSHSFIVKIELPASSTLRSGLFGRAEFDGPAHRALVMPASAVVRRGQLAFVFTVDTGQARLRQISPGPATAAGVEITAGLSAGESVITSHTDALADGARVSVAGGRR